MAYSLLNDRPVVIEESAYASNNSQELGVHSYTLFALKEGIAM